MCLHPALRAEHWPQKPHWDLLSQGSCFIHTSFLAPSPCTKPPLPCHPSHTPPVLPSVPLFSVGLPLARIVLWVSCERKRRSQEEGRKGKEKKEITRKRWDQHQAHDPQLPLPCPGGDTRLGTPHSEEDIASCTSSFPQLLGWMLTRIYFSWVSC